MTTNANADFVVTAESRFEKCFEAYDRKSHSYHPNYVNPKTRRILLKAKAREHRKGVVYEWRVRQKQGGAVFQKSGEKMTQVGFNVPAVGEYECTLTVKSSDGRRASHTKDFRLRDFLIASIGDSYASGEGNPDVPGKPEGFGDSISGWDWLNFGKVFSEAVDWGWNRLKQEATTLSRKFGATIDMDPAPVWWEPQAHRSLRSGPALAARNLEKPERGDLITFLSFARSGAEIRAGLLGPRTKDKRPIDGWIGQIGQIKEMENALQGRPIDALIISIGGNDVGFGPRLTDLVAGDLFGDDTKNRQETIRKVREAIAALDESYARLAQSISKLNVRRVYITEYPTGLFDKIVNGKSQPSGGCGIFESGFDLDITPRDASDLKAVARELNRKIAAVAEKHNWIYVGGIADEFEGHGYCMGKQSYFVGAEESLVTQGDTEGVMHPNAKGHAVYAEQVGKKLRTVTSERVSAKKGKPSDQPRPRVKVRDHREKPQSPVKPRPSRPGSSPPKATVRDHRSN